MSTRLASPTEVSLSRLAAAGASETLTYGPIGLADKEEAPADPPGTQSPLTAASRPTGVTGQLRLVRNLPRQSSDSSRGPLAVERKEMAVRCGALGPLAGLVGVCMMRRDVRRGL